MGLSDTSELFSSVHRNENKDNIQALRCTAANARSFYCNSFSRGALIYYLRLPKKETVH